MKDWLVSNEAQPQPSDPAGQGYQHLQDNLVRVRERIAQEHEFGINTAQENLRQGLHRPGSALVLITSGFPTTRQSGQALGSFDIGYLIYHTINKRFYYWSGTAFVAIEDPRTDQDLKTTDKPTFKGVYVGTAPVTVSDGQVFADEVKANKFVARSNSGSIADFDGRAAKIRTAAPTTPSDGDIWIE